MTQARHRAARRPNPHVTNLRLLWVSQFTNTAGLMMLVPIMPFYVERLGVNGTATVQTWAGVAIAAPAITLTVATPLWGRLGDRVGRKWMVVRALVGLGIAMVVMAAATGPLVLLLGRLLQGALGGVVEAAAGFVGAAAPDEARGTSLGKSFSATAAGALTGPLVGGAMLGASGLRPFMVAIAVIAVLLAGLCAWGLREATPASPGDGRPASRDRRIRDRLRLPGLVPLGAAAALVYLGVYGLIPVFAEHVATTVQRASTAGLWVGALHSVMWAATLLGSVWWGKRNDRTGRPLASFVLAASVCAVSIAALAVPMGPIGLIPIRVVQGFCFAALAQSLFLYFSHAVPGPGQSERIGVVNSFLLVGQGVGPLLAGPLTAFTSASRAIVLLGGACAVAALLALVPARREHWTQRDSRGAGRSPSPRAGGADPAEALPGRASNAA